MIITGPCLPNCSILGMKIYTYISCVLKNFFTDWGAQSKSGVTGMGALLGTLSGYFPL